MRKAFAVLAGAALALAQSPRPVRPTIGEVINRPEFSDRHLRARSLVPAANTPEQFADDIKRERVIAEQVVKDAHIREQRSYDRNQRNLDLAGLR